MAANAAADVPKENGTVPGANGTEQKRYRLYLHRIARAARTVKIQIFGGEEEDEEKLAETHAPTPAAKKDPKTDAAYRILGIRFRPTWVIDPSTNFYYRWLMIMSLAILYNTIMIVPRAVWHELEESYAYIVTWFVLDYGCDFLYVVDIVIHLITGYLDQGLIVTEPRKLARHYFRTFGSRLDILSILPTDLIYLATGFGAPYLAVRLNRLLRLPRLSEFIYRTETRTSSPNVFRMGTLLLGLVIIFHLYGCFYYAISDHMGISSDKWVYPGAAYWRLPPPPKAVEDACAKETLSFEDLLSAGAMGNSTTSNSTTEMCANLKTNHGDPLYQKYTWSFYWSTLILTTIAEVDGPVKLAQYPFVIVGLLIGVLVFATILGNVGSMISNMNTSRVEYQETMDGVKHYMEFRGVGRDLQNKIIKWFDYIWSNNQSIDEEAVLESLPEKLRAEIAMHVHLDTLKRVSIFQDVEPGLLVELVLKLQLQVYSPGDYICRKGDIGKEMFIVKRGKLDVVSDNGQVVFVTLSDGSVFGEISILNIVGNKTGNRRTANVRSVGYSDLFCLSKDDLWDALTEYPEAKKKLMERGRSMLTKDGLIDEEVAREAEKRSQNVEDKVDRLDQEVESTESRFVRLLSDYTASQQKLKQRLTRLEDAVKRHRRKPPKEQAGRR